MPHPVSFDGKEWARSALASEHEAAVQPFAALRVLVVEDLMLIAMEVEDALDMLGCRVAGPVGRLGPALSMARDGSFDAAILDVRLDGDLVFPVAELLKERNIPLAFLTSYPASTLPAAWRDTPLLRKPLRHAELRRFLRRAAAAAIGTGRGAEPAS